MIKFVTFGDIKKTNTVPHLIFSFNQAERCLDKEKVRNHEIMINQTSVALNIWSKKSWFDTFYKQHHLIKASTTFFKI